MTEVEERQKNDNRHVGILHNRKMLDVWFVFLPVITIAFVVHQEIFFWSRGVNCISPLAPEGVPSHVSWILFASFFFELFVTAFVCLSSTVLIWILIYKHPSLCLKLIWSLFAFLLSPIICPICYFTILRKQIQTPTG
jgi:hypothetical protein